MLKASAKDAFGVDGPKDRIVHVRVDAALGDAVRSETTAGELE